MRPCIFHPTISISICCLWAHESLCLWGFLWMPTHFFSFHLCYIPGSLDMSSLSLPFEFSQDSNMTPLSKVYSTPGLLGNLSGLSGTTTVSPSTPLDSSLLSLANIAYGPNGTHWAQGRTITYDPNAYIQLAHHYQQMECEFTKDREECASLK